jgi:hypothetical protein
MTPARAKASSGEAPEWRRFNSDGLVSRDGYNGVGITNSSGVPISPQRNKCIKYRYLEAATVNGR